MINTEAVESMLEELEQCEKNISLLAHHVLCAERGQVDNVIYTKGALEMLERTLKREQVNARFINDLLAIEYEQLEIVPILKQLQA